MYYFGTIIAVPEGQQPPANLPDEFHSYVEVVEIVDSHLPGYVHLKLKKTNRLHSFLRAMRNTAWQSYDLEAKVSGRDRTLQAQILSRRKRAPK